jgi:putative lipoprotein
MKLKYFFSAVLTACLALAFTACSNEEDSPEVKPEPKVETALTFDTDTVSVGVGETTTFNITAGGGEYKAFSENPDVATMTIDGNKISVTAVKSGFTGIVVSDAAGNYKRVLVKAMYKTLLLDKDEVNMTIKVGHTDGYALLTVTGGNGGYEAVSDHNDIVDIYSIENGVITIKALSNGTAMITITDKMGVSKVVKVTVTTTDIPYSDEEKADIMASTSETIVFDNTQSRGYGSKSIGEKDGKQLAQWNYYDGIYIKCWFSGDLTIGMKTDGKVEVKSDYWGTSVTQYEGVNVEILKVSDTHVWGIMWVLKDNYLHYGYFVLPKGEAED